MFHSGSQIEEFNYLQALSNDSNFLLYMTRDLLSYVMSWMRMTEIYSHHVTSPWNTTMENLTSVHLVPFVLWILNNIQPKLHKTKFTRFETAVHQLPRRGTTAENPKQRDAKICTPMIPPAISSIALYQFVGIFKGCVPFTSNTSPFPVWNSFTTYNAHHVRKWESRKGIG